MGNHAELHFNPRPPRGGRRVRCGTSPQEKLEFQSTPPARGATRWSIQSISIIGISIHAPREGGDHSDAVSLLRQSQISIHAPREGGDRSSSSGHRTRIISIHAPREGGDPSGEKIDGLLQDFNPRPPRGGRPPTIFSPSDRPMISIHAPREGGDDHEAFCQYRKSISIHAPREGGDDDLDDSPGGTRISIHAPREGGDLVGVLLQVHIADFNPRPPRGGRHPSAPGDRCTHPFQSTPPARGATATF